MKEVLLLNSDAQPLNIFPLSSITYRRAIKLVYFEKASVISHYKDRQLNSMNRKIEFPSIILLNEHKKIQHRVGLHRFNILLRDDFKCQYCGFDGYLEQEKLTIDHVLPRKLKGRTIWENVTTACRDCNVKKSHHLSMYPSIIPFQPTYWQLVNQRKKYPITIPHESWKDFINWDEHLILIRTKMEEVHNHYHLSFL